MLSLGESPASEIYMPTFRKMKMEESVPKRRHINFRRRGFTQKKAYNNHEDDFSGSDDDFLGFYEE